MNTILLAFGILLVVVLAPLTFGLGPQWTAIPGMILGVGSFVWISRRIAKRVEAVTKAADAELAAMQQVAQRPTKGTQAAVAHRFDKAIEILKRGFAFEKWQFGVSTMLNARIGMLLFSRHLVLPNAKLTEAIPYLERSRIRGKKAKLLQGLWPAWAMLAVCHYKGKKDPKTAIGILEEITPIAKKDGLLWQLRAWMLWKEKRLDDAIEVLVAAQDVLPDDERVAENLKALRNRKGMKMKAYGEQWYQFGLEKPKVAGAQVRMPHPRAKMRAGRRR